MFGLTGAERSSVGLAVAKFVGIVAPALIGGAIWGWISFSRSQWGWATGVLLVGTFVVLEGPPLNKYFKEQNNRPAQSEGVVPVPDTK